MTTTRALLVEQLQARVGVATWSEPELASFVNSAIRSLFPSFWKLKVAETLASEGPLQAVPSGCSHIYQLGVKRPTSTRVRSVRGWTEGTPDTLVPKTGIDGHTLVWSWVAGWDAPDEDDDDIDLPMEAEEVVLLRAHVSCLQALLTGRLQSDRYNALFVRQQISESDINDTIDSLQASIRARIDTAMPLPEIRR